MQYRKTLRRTSLQARLATTLSAALATSAILATSASAHPDPAKKKVAILIFDSVEVIDYSGPLEVLGDAGFEVFTVAASKKPVTTHLGPAVKLTPQYSFADAPQADLIVIPGGGFEAAKGSPTVAWIKKEAEHAEYVMSVCNGAFTLANTGLLDGLSATTTAGNINRFRQTFPQIKVITDKRVVDNGKILATAGLSSGIDGAFHLVELMKGSGAGRSVALDVELDWSPEQRPFVRGVNADRLIPSVYASLHAAKLNDPIDHRLGGDNDRWERTYWYATPQTPAEVFEVVKAAYQKAYTAEGGPWVPNSFAIEPAGPLTANLKFDDRDGQHWRGVLTVAREPEAGELSWRFAIERAGSSPAQSGH
jgi:putative intracellular protease/amidase